MAIGLSVRCEWNYPSCSKSAGNLGSLGRLLLNRRNMMLLVAVVQMCRLLVPEEELNGRVVIDVKWMNDLYHCDACLHTNGTEPRS